MLQAAHDDSAPTPDTADAAAAHAPPLSAAERGAVLAGLPDDEREATAAVLGKLGGADVKVLEAAPDVCTMHVVPCMHATLPRCVQAEAAQAQATAVNCGCRCHSVNGGALTLPFHAPELLAARWRMRHARRGCACNRQQAQMPPAGLVP